MPNPEVKEVKEIKYLCDYLPPFDNMNKEQIELHVIKLVRLAKDATNIIEQNNKHIKWLKKVALKAFYFVKYAHPNIEGTDEIIDIIKSIKT